MVEACAVAMKPMSMHSAIPKIVTNLFILFSLLLVSIILLYYPLDKVEYDAFSVIYQKPCKGTTKNEHLQESEQLFVKKIELPNR